MTTQKPEKPKSVVVYHYDRGLGESFHAFLGKGYSVEYVPISRETHPVGSIANMLASGAPDLVFLALNFGEWIVTPTEDIPKVTRFNEGLEELVRIRAINKKVPVVIVSGGGYEQMQAALDKGANRYLAVFPERGLLDELKEIAESLTSNPSQS